jgi:hypothetical protein
MIERVIVVGDLLRPNGDGSPGGADRSSAWLHDAIKRQVHLAAGCIVKPLSVFPALHDWLEAERPAVAADRFWAASYHRAPVTAENLIIPHLQSSFVVGYELPPWLIGLLDRLRTPYVDFRIHPVRFLDDLLFAVRSPRPETQAALLDMAVPEAEVIATAGLREAMCRYISDARVPPNTLLVAGQRRFDSTQIAGGGFYDALDQAAAVHALCARYDQVVLKPHPQDRYHSLLVTAAAGPGRVLGVIEDNIYRLLSLPQIAGVLTVNSGVAQEAAYFGKQVYTLLPAAVTPAWRGSAPRAGTHASLDDVALTPDFWRIVLTPHLPTTKPDGMRLRPKPNRLRIALDSFWNYQQIDTDRVPRPPVA